MSCAKPNSIQRAGLWLATLLILGACDRTPTTYFPLEVGRYWQYTIARTTMDGNVTQKYLLETLPLRDWRGVRVAGKRTVDGHQYFYQTDEDGVRRVAYKRRGDKELRSENPSLTILPAAPEIGATWERPTQTIVLENSGPPWETLFRITRPLTLEYTVASTTDVVRVPAGEFRDCLRVVGTGRIDTDVGNTIGRAIISVEVTEWYAPNVGLVRSRRIETTDIEALDYGAIHMQLESY
jgi:hypothetical protein